MHILAAMVEGLNYVLTYSAANRYKKSLHSIS
jgi:hypothetical protein